MNPYKIILCNLLFFTAHSHIRAMDKPDTSEYKKVIGNRMLIAALVGDLEIVQQAIAQGVDVNYTRDTLDSNQVYNTYQAQYYQSWPALHCAAHSGHEQIVEYLIERVHAMVDYEDEFGATALTRAAEKCSPACIRILIKNGANVNHKANRDVTPLIEVTMSFSWPRIDEKLRLECLSLLIEAGADIESTHSSTDTALCFAAKEYPELVRILIKAGANINHKNLHGETPLSHAIYSRKLDSVRMLVEHGADVKSVTKGLSILNWAAYTCCNDRQSVASWQSNGDNSDFTEYLSKSQSICHFLVEAMLEKPDAKQKKRLVTFLLCLQHIKKKNPRWALKDLEKMFQPHLLTVIVQENGENVESPAHKEAYAEVNKIPDETIKNELLAKYFPTIK